MNVFCNRENCKFQLNQLCRTSAISIEQGECTTFVLADAGQSKTDTAVSWGHLEINPSPDEEPNR
ncbi:MAG: hypothetical protein ACYC5A_01655 [Thermoleophilia bacterium]